MSATTIGDDFGPFAASDGMNPSERNRKMTAATLEATISRTFDATPEQLWACITEPRHFAAWFGTPPFTTPVSTVTMDVRPGGAFAATMVHETDGVELPFRGTYVEVVPGEKIVQVLEDVTGETENVETLTLTVEGNQLTYHQTGQLPP